MLPEELAARHPRLFHVTHPDALPSIERHGLLPTSQLLDLFGITGPARVAIERTRRPARVPLRHPDIGQAVITDNRPLSRTALMSCLDDGLSPEDWLMRLNERVFFWPDERGVGELLNARLNRGCPRLVLVLDTLGLARRYAETVELSAINTGSTIRRPARRGLMTFTPLLRHDYRAWQALRGGRDRIREVTVRGRVDAIGDVLIRADRHP